MCGRDMFGEKCVSVGVAMMKVYTKKKSVAPQTKALAGVAELVCPDGITSVLPAVTNGTIYVGSKVYCRNGMTLGRRPRIGDRSLSQGVSPLIPINTHMGLDPV
ncbi:hypothetical protein Pcinc_015947 [Petrolisthes cinctipes]|uniref:Uncharacterized protein n=1 Tax=Petrolisthes cinctipes TaxID=88211 RepID=A0AAE1KP84_PETCI|nr:hypothetical protein Pcinc_015947 [Petrolisthes cinctipes]